MSKHLVRPVDENDLHAFVDGLLDATRRQEVQDHLDRHPADAAMVASLSMQRQLLRSTLAPIADEPVPERLQIHSLLAQRDAPQPWRWRMAAAVVMALGTGTVGGWQMRDVWDPAPSSGIVALAGEARSSFAAYSTQGPGETDRAALLHQVSTQLQRPVEIPDLSKSGYRYAGGRVVATAHGSGGLFFYERQDGTRIAMMVRPMLVDKEAPMLKHSTGAVRGFTWAARGLGYSVVGTDAPEALHPIADEVRRQLRNDAV